MGTRSTIKIEGVDFAKVYKHWDGNPTATLPWLQAFNSKFNEERGADPEYKFAQLLRSSVSMQEAFELDSSTSTGWGVVPFGVNMGEEFEYTLKADGTVSCKEM